MEGLSVAADTRVVVTCEGGETVVVALGDAESLIATVFQTAAPGTSWSSTCGCCRPAPARVRAPAPGTVMVVSHDAAQIIRLGGPVLTLKNGRAAL